MKKNLYFRNSLRRENVVKKAILDFFLGWASYARLIIEVFIRKNFGERYFSIASVITVALLLAILPPVASSLVDLLPHRYNSYEEYRAAHTSFWSRYALWYLFIAVFLFFSWRRSREIKRNPSVFEFARFSLCSGDIHPLFSSIKLFGRKVNIREIETLIEPALFIIIGLILGSLGQRLGVLFFWSGIFYSLSYVAAYKRGDDFVMDKIDEMIMNEEMYNAFVEGEENNSRGVRFYGQRPNTKEAREKVMESFFEYTAEEEITYAT